MTNEQYYSPFNLQLQSFTHLSEINSIITALGESETSTLQELGCVAHALHHLLIRTDACISLQAQKLKQIHQDS